MAKSISVNGTTFLYPEAGEDPGLYGEEATAWAEEVSTVLASVVGVGDILQTNFNLDNNQTGSLANITGFIFDSNQVKGVSCTYRIERTNATTYLIEKGQLELVFNPQTSTWQIQREYVGDGGIDLDITAGGQLQYKINTQILSPAQTSGFIRFETLSTIT
jgi:hypothetical protein